MSQENVDLVLRVQPDPEVDLAQVYRDDEMWAASVEVFAPFFHPDCEFAVQGLPGGEGKEYAGLDGLRDLMLDWIAPWATYRSEIEEAIDCGGRVLVPYHAFGRREGSTAELKITATSVSTIRAGKFARVEFYIDHAEALKAVGLGDG